MGRDAHLPKASLGLGWADVEAPAHVVGGALNLDPAVQQVSVPALEPQELPQAEMAPRRKLNGNPPALRQALID
jgi:hypothetical protein